MNNTTVRKLPLAEIFKSALRFFVSKPLAMLVYSLINYAIIIIGIATWSQPAFLLLAVAAYAFWSWFFRWYFDKRPYFDRRSLFSSLAPSTKILVLGFIVMTILILLPFAPLFLGFNGQYADRYLAFLQKYMQENQTIDAVLSIITVFIAPYILFRPFFAWIGSLIGRNGNLRFAMQKTRGNYWQIVALLLVLNIPFMIVEQAGNWLGWSSYVRFFLMSPLIVYGNLLIAKSYEYFFMEE